MMEYGWMRKVFQTYIDTDVAILCAGIHYHLGFVALLLCVCSLPPGTQAPPSCLLPQTTYIHTYTPTPAHTPCRMQNEHNSERFTHSSS